LDDLKSEDAGDTIPRSSANLSLKYFKEHGKSEIVNRLSKMEDKYKDQSHINSELADKIQQLEFDKDMLQKENENLKKHEINFDGLLE